MNGIDLLVVLAAGGLLALLIKQTRRWKRQDEARARHEENQRHWRIIERIEAYSYYQAAPDYIPVEWEQAA